MVFVLPWLTSSSTPLGSSRLHLTSLLCSFCVLKSACSIQALTSEACVQVLLRHLQIWESKLRLTFRCFHVLLRWAGLTLTSAFQGDLSRVWHGQAFCNVQDWLQTPPAWLLLNPELRSLLECICESYVSLGHLTSLVQPCLPKALLLQLRALAGAVKLVDLESGKPELSTGGHLCDLDRVNEPPGHFFQLLKVLLFQSMNIFPREWW